MPRMLNCDWLKFGHVTDNKSTVSSSFVYYWCYCFKHRRYWVLIGWCSHSL